MFRTELLVWILDYHFNVRFIWLCTSTTDQLASLVSLFVGWDLNFVVLFLHAIRGCVRIGSVCAGTPAAVHVTPHSVRP